MSYAEGTLVRSTAVFKNSGGTLVDPTNVFVKVTSGLSGLTATIFTYGVDDEVVKDATGTYHIDIDTTGRGNACRYRWYSTGNYQVTGEKYELRISPMEI